MGAGKGERRTHGHRPRKPRLLLWELLQNDDAEILTFL